MSNTNPLLEGLKLPGRVFQLPSRGLFYRNGELADNVKDGEVHVHPMSALDEINMKNPDQLFSGAAVNTVFSRCVPAVLKPTELLSKDVDAIMVYLRAVTYGSSYEFLAKHSCESKPIVNEKGESVIPESKEHSYVANLDEMIANMKIIDPTLVNQMYTVKLPSYEVKLRPNRYSQVLDILKANENKTEITVEDQQKNLVMMLMGVIESVNGVTDQNHLKEWIEQIPSPLVNRIAEKIENVNDWGTDLRVNVKCRDCGEPFSVEIPINPVSFFIE